MEFPILSVVTVVAFDQTLRIECQLDLPNKRVLQVTSVKALSGTSECALESSDVKILETKIFSALQHQNEKDAEMYREEPELNYEDIDRLKQSHTEFEYGD